MINACSSGPPSFTAHGTLTISAGILAGGATV
jgi:hypothetical protein